MEERKKIDADFILNTLKVMVESKKLVSREEWIGIAFKLTILRIDEAKLFNSMHQAVAKKKLDIKRSLEKPSVAAVKQEIEATDEFKFLQDQSDKLYSLDELVRVAKKASDTF